MGGNQQEVYIVLLFVLVGVVAGLIGGPWIGLAAAVLAIALHLAWEFAGAAPTRRPRG